jgi:hypothetical protein
MPCTAYTRSAIVRLSFDLQNYPYRVFIPGRVPVCKYPPGV